MQESTDVQNLEDTMVEGIILHITDNENELFPELKEDCNETETRRVYLNNKWQNHTNYEGILEENPSIYKFVNLMKSITYMKPSLNLFD